MIYTDIFGFQVDVDDDDVNWLEDGFDLIGRPCSRYDLGNGETVWLDSNYCEVDAA